MAKKARCIMVQGTMSGAGKSLLCAALCRIFAQDGLRAAPFKSQNMALNSAVTKDGLEMGRAQYMQAEAAGIEPDVRMNPVLLKPCSDTGSQVIVNGEIRAQMSAKEYFAYKKQLIPEILAAYESLAAENDVIVIEGAGSPAEINLRQDDIVNMGLAELVDAPVLLAGDIDRGGVFAQLYGTAALLAPSERQRVKGLIINKFRGDVGLLQPGLAQLEQLTGIPVAGVVPMLKVEVDDEDSLAPGLQGRSGCGAVDIAVVRLPHISNFTDFAPLATHPALSVRYVGAPAQLAEPDLVILPGTKSTTADLLWLRESGLEAAILRLAGLGVPVLGVCGGYQMMGKTLHDPHGCEGDTPEVRGMELLDCKTVFTADKTRTRKSGRVLAGLLQGARMTGYELHQGRTVVNGSPFLQFDSGEYDGCVSGKCAGTYLHGLFDSDEALDTLAEGLCRAKGIEPQARAMPRAEWRQSQYDLLADGVRKALDMQRIYKILEG